MSATDVARFSLRLPTELLERVAATRGRRSVNAEMISRLEASFTDALGGAGVATPGLPASPSAPNDLNRAAKPLDRRTQAEAKR